MIPASEQPTAAVLDRLAREYSFRNELENPWAVRPLALEGEGGQIALLLEDPGGELLGGVLDAPMEMPLFLRLASGIVDALGKVHQHGIIHKDIKPANILVNAATGEARLTGFGVASRLSQERQAPLPPELIAGTLPYMAPEQTGRMNRSIDSRSDLYSLGVTFYQMLTGTLPFIAHDPMEWVHCHIARKPIPPSRRIEEIPSPISEIVMKLLAKTAEERYQTTAGVQHDLQRCRAEGETRGRVDVFALGQRDVPDRLLIPEKLYGREDEVAALLKSFGHVVATGVPELVLVSGYSGVGKSSVVNELHKVLVPPRGLFAAGKFDQYVRDIPYATVAQAFQGLVRQILSKNEAELQIWRDALRDALGSNGLLIVNLIPELELVIGKQPPVTELPPQDTQRRFQTVLRRFISVFARPEHPLALFLDDLQWLDAATLDLLEDLLTQPDVRHLLLIGAYRDNEVNATHTLARKLEVINRAGATIQHIVLAPLKSDDVERLVSDALSCELLRVTSLAQLVHQKTDGNPFFVIQFLSALAEEALLFFDHIDGRWAWDVQHIHAKRYTDNVVDLMVGKLGRLPTETQMVLRQLACVGSGATFALLNTVCEISSDSLHDSLWEAVRTGLVIRLDDSYAFQHDRIQEAAYSLIPVEARGGTHLRIGRLLLANTSPNEREVIIFDIVSQFSRSATLIVLQDEREKVAQLNLIAGKRAKNAAAYSTALILFVGAQVLLGEQAWTRNYRLAFELEFNRAECEFLSSDLESADERLSALAKRAENNVDLAAVTSLQVDLYIMLARSERSIEVGLDYLRQVGIDWSPHPADDDVRQEHERLRNQLAGRAIETLIDLPLMSDADTQATMNVLSKLMPSGINTDKNFNSLVITRMMNLSLEYGNSNASCLSYMATDFGNHLTALRFAQLSLDLVEKRGLDVFKARIYLRFGGNVSPLTQHFRLGHELILRACDEADRTGDTLYSSHSRSYAIKSLIASGAPLDEVERVALGGLEYARKTRSGFVFTIILNKIYFVRKLRGLPLDLRMIDGTEVNEQIYEMYLESDPDLTNPAFAYWTRKLQVCVVQRDFKAALDAVMKGRGILTGGPSIVERVEYQFYAALALAGSIHGVEGIQSAERTANCEAIMVHLQQIRAWAEQCPENFENRAALVAAELARLECRDLDAGRLYEQAIRSARANGFSHNEALACEAAAHFYAAGGFEDIAHMYLERAREGFLRWGADSKVRQLDARYPGLDSSDPRDGVKAAASPDQQLDLAAVVKASQALSGEMLLPRLIERLMTIALQNAGADRGLLILTRGNDYRIEAEACTDGERIILHYGAAAGAAVPESLIRYVMRTRESVILNDATRSNAFSEDPYFGRRNGRSVLCLPLVRQGALVAVLYLENALASHVFTPDRARLLELLGSQAAISLENTRLYGDLQEREAKVRRLVDSNIIGICIFDLDSRIIEANDAFLSIVGYDRDDVAAGRLSFAGLTPPDLASVDERLQAELASTGAWRPSEKCFFRKDGGRVPVLVGGASFGELGQQGVAFVVNLTERKLAEEAARESESRYRETQNELSRANRIATMGELTASIAHEVNQPIAACVTNAETAVRWLAREPPNVQRARQVITRVVADGKRAADIVGRIRALVEKAPARRDALDLNETVLEVIELTRAKLSDHDVVLQTELAQDMPLIEGDRVQLQQVFMNLIMNAIEAMSEMDAGRRELKIGVGMEGEAVKVVVQDSGPGLSEDALLNIFEAFHTTKSTGLGLGLSICRSIVEGHGGRLWASANVPRGVAMQFTMPARVS
ncbi:trifunctional serine/threonine-protein kinase/ATP-binding protein/sensor histidine kinase [Tardiphaga robiniae]|uniref:histidine kinase n=1 Tax=Tardiphaga robiniae TaxID=943830 RepID=A0A7G6TU02_9BRAD|nr:AAA family ATPase [Tardiphaga robiniae]QND70234.1 AAA family ATPase [Tardiphaga robiniae]